MPDPISWSIALPHLLIALLLGYLLGSIPFGVILTKAFGAGDLSKIGSGNIGATNVLRTGRKSLAAATLLGDLLKGTAAVLIAKHLWGPDQVMMAGLGAFLGHLYPIWLKFKGGKGVATYIGILLGLAWQMALLFGAIWLIMAFLFRISSLAALVASLIVPISLWWFGYVQEAQLFSLLTLLVWFKHRENIKRILTGNESRIGDKG